MAILARLSPSDCKNITTHRTRHSHLRRRPVNYKRRGQPLASTSRNHRRARSHGDPRQANMPRPRAKPSLRANKSGVVQVELPRLLHTRGLGRQKLGGHPDAWL
eukprot:scaffold120750_cov32-Prasinocladus_malaysianus.AAC.1